jgi:D-beta-D-heptose 7-phosphate kinase/D-beta-D-heptose 1-phosphate adenosyltransferase
MKRVFTNGCFDVIHPAHIKLLEYCKSIGYVIVGLNSDESVKEQKGNTRPVFSAQDRKYVLESYRYVDEVHIFSEKTPYNLIKKIKPDIIVKGGDYKAENVVGTDLCKVIIFDYIDGYSTTKTIQNLVNR